MAALPNFQVKENEFYEIQHDIPSHMHPQPKLRSIKIMMVSETTTTGKYVCKWPSMESLKNFFNERDSVLPDFDNECILTEHDVSLLVVRHIDPVHLCFYYERTPSNWLDSRGVEILNDAMNLVEEFDIERSIRPDQFYEIDRNALPPMLRDEIGFARIALVDGVTEDPNEGHPTVKVAFPSTECLDAFLSSESLLLPDFDRVFTISHASASPFLKRVLPLGLCFPHRKRRDFWNNDTDN